MRQENARKALESIARVAEHLTEMQRRNEPYPFSDGDDDVDDAAELEEPLAPLEEPRAAVEGRGAEPRSRSRSPR